MNVNALRDLMKFADESEMFGKGWSDSASSYNPRAKRAQWATQMLEQGGGMSERPDYFAENVQPPEAPAYVAPERAAPMQPRMAAKRDPRMDNFLARLMGR
jgi:hypothetical protein